MRATPLLCLLLSAAVPRALGLSSAVRAADDLTVIRDRLLGLSVVPPTQQPAFDASISTYLSLLQPNGTFADLDYNTSKPSWWPTIFHAVRVRAMTRAYISRSSAYVNSTTLVASTLSAMDWWLRVQPTTPGEWFEPQVGIPEQLAPPLLTLQALGLLASNQTVAAERILALPTTDPGTDANVVWKAANMLYHGLFLHSPGIVANATGILWGAVAVVGEGVDGIHADFAFQMHNRQVYTGGYGMPLAQILMEVAAYTAWTAYAPSPAKLALLVSFLRHGALQPIFYGGASAAVWDVSVIGREISRPIGVNVQGCAGQFVTFEPTTVAAFAGILSTSESTYFTAFAALLNRSASAADRELAIVGSRLYHTSDYFLHTRPGWMASIRLVSKRMHSCEGINGENLRGGHLSDGATYLYTTGAEYVDVFPAWDWERVPGTTVNPYASTQKLGGAGLTSFVGGVSDKLHGVVAMYWEGVAGSHAGVLLRRSSFFFNDSFVVLGANITNTAGGNASSSNRSLWTTIEQARAVVLPGVFTSATGPDTPLPPGSNVSLGASAWWVWHGGVGYLFPEFAPGAAATTASSATNSLHVSNAEQTGDWSDIGEESGAVSLAMFTLWLEHEGAASGPAAFAYIVVPRAGDVLSFAEAAPTLLGAHIILANTPTTQAVLHGVERVLGVTFFAAGGGAVDGGPGWAFTASHGGTFIVAESPPAGDTAANGSGVVLSAAWPQQSTWNVTMRLDRTLVPSSAPVGGAACTSSGAVFASPPADGGSQVLACSVGSVGSAAGIVASPPPLVPPRNLSSFALFNTSALRARPWPYANSSKPVQTWSQTATCCGYGNFTVAAVTAASDAIGIWDMPCLDQQPHIPLLAEWGYEFMQNVNNIFPICANLSMQGYANPPTSRDEALQRLRLYWECRAADTRASVNASATAPLISEIGHYMYAGLSAAFANASAAAYAVLPGSEVGENINSIQLHLAATRGAARTYGVPFLIDFSPWFAGFITDYSDARFWGEASSPTGGHSVSLVHRTYVAAFMAGTGCLVSEAGAVNFFVGNVPADGLSPLGSMGADFFALTHNASVPGGAEGVRGIPYVPIAIVSSTVHGMGLGWWYNSLAWDLFPLSDAESRLNEWLQPLWPGSFNVESQDGTSTSETGYLVASPFGDIADLLLPVNLTSDVLLQAYRVVVFAGLNEPMSQELAAVVSAYVLAGGCVILCADDIAVAAAQGWLAPSILGLEALNLSTGVVAQVTEVRDVQTGWSSTPRSGAGSPFCVQNGIGGSAAWFIQTGGDPTASGWDGGNAQKCCSSDAANCLWFSSAGECGAALLLAPAICRACPSPLYNAARRSSASDVGCPAWKSSSGNASNASMPVALASAVLTTAQPVLSYTLADGTSAVSATLNTVGTGLGAVVVQLAPGARSMGAAGLGVTQHLLSRLQDDVSPFNPLTSNVSTDGAGGGVQLLVNRVPDGWVATLMNNHGVVKQPGTAPTIDPAQGRRVFMSLKPEVAAAVTAAWATDGVGQGVTPLQMHMQRGQHWESRRGATVSVDVEVEAGGVRFVTFQLGGSRS